VAHTRVKTPTAAAEFIISRAFETIAHLMNLQDRLIYSTRSILNYQEKQLNSFSKDIYHHSKSVLHSTRSSLNFLRDRLKSIVKHSIEKERFILQKYDNFVSLSSPENMLRRGYTITTKNGKTIKSILEIEADDIISTHFKDGEVRSKIVNKTSNI